MKNLKITHNERRERMASIKMQLEALDDKEIKHIEHALGYEPPMNAVPMLILKLYYYHQDEDHQAGYSIHIDKKTFEPTRVAWFRADGSGTYRHSVLNYEEIEDFKRYYKKHLQHLRKDFCISCHID